MSSRQKRPWSAVDDVVIPPEDCTRDTFDQHANLSDRQFLCWALQTESRVRFAKLQGRDDYTFGQQDTTLNSEYLLDLYPAIGDEETGKKKKVLARERHAYGRKSLLYLQSMRVQDASFETLTRVKIDRTQSNDLKKKAPKAGPEYLPIPPNLLYFEIILEAFMGYKVPSFHSNDPSQPRAAVMGGAIVAALTAWRGKKVLGIFEDVDDVLKTALEEEDKEKYQSAKEKIRQSLHEYFLHDDSASLASPFCTGDVDIFLQTSPLTRSLMDKMSDLPTEVIDIASGHLGGCGYVHRDLEDFAASFCSDYLAPKFKDLWNSDWRKKDGMQNKFCYALTTNGLSFALGAAQECPPFNGEKDTWPRTTQLIMLNERADLVGGLMDFDISVASCAYDGNGVYATPRAAFSLKTFTQVVTPFVYEEKRNRSRITKYYQRGFDAFIIDPYCSHEVQCVNEHAIIGENNDAPDPATRENESLLKHADDSDRIEVVHLQDADWRARSLCSDEKYEEICEAQRNDNVFGEFICQSGCGRCERSYWYSIALIEKSEGHAFEYFAQRDRWSEELREDMEEIPEHQRLACRQCRRAYGLSLVLDKAPSEVTAIGSVQDLLHGEWSYRHSIGHCGDFDPSFYSGGAFNSFFVGSRARSWSEQLGVLMSQQRIEEARYIRRYGTNDGYQARFVYGDTLESVFRDAANANLPRNGRAPVGLNPERFIAKCKGCQEWLHECEFNVKYCNQCVESKPAAVED